MKIVIDIVTYLYLVYKLYFSKHIFSNYTPIKKKKKALIFEGFNFFEVKFAVHSTKLKTLYAV